MTEKRKPSGSSGTPPVGEKDSDTILSASERYNHFRPIPSDGKGIRITADGLVYDTIRDSDEYVETSMQFTNGHPIRLTQASGGRKSVRKFTFAKGRPIYLTKGRTPEEDFAIEEYFVSSGILVFHQRIVKMRYECDPAGVTERLARLPKGGDTKELATQCMEKATWFENEAQRCKAAIKKAKKRHASAEEIEELRYAARLHIRVSKEYHKALRLMQPIVEAVAEARHEAETTFRRMSARDISLHETRRARTAATQAHITVCTLLSDAAAQNRAGSCPPPDSNLISVFTTPAGAVA